MICRWSGESGQSVRLVSVRATARTERAFAEVLDAESWAAVVEINRGDAMGDVIALLTEIVTILKGQEIAHEARVVEHLGLTPTRLSANRPLAAAVSALRTASHSLKPCTA